MFSASSFSGGELFILINAYDEDEPITFVPPDLTEEPDTWVI